jgi:hypothetical protein
MNATRIRTRSGEIPSTDLLLKLEKRLNAAFKRSGFETQVTLKTRSALKIGLHMCSFRIDPEKLGYNADRGFCGSRCSAGFKRTRTPTWEQRESFNHLVNDAFDALKLSARIKSGPFLVRSALMGRVNVWSLSDLPNTKVLLRIKSLSEVA